MPTEAQRAQALRLEAAAVRRAAVLERLNAAFARELGRVLRDLERNLLARVPAIKAGSRTATALAARSLVLRRELREALRDAGYDRLVDVSTEATFARLERTVAATTVGRQVVRFVAGDPGLDTLRALRVLATTGLDYQGDEVAIALWRSLTQGLYADRSVRDIVADLADAIDRSEREARTLYDTAATTYTRTLEAISTPGGPTEAFLYTGPDDLKIREFCKAHVGRVYTRRSISAMDNDTPDLADVFLHGGGYNCRHVWLHVPQGSALSEVADTGEDTRGRVLTLRRAA